VATVTYQVIGAYTGRENFLQSVQVIDGKQLLPLTAKRVNDDLSAHRKDEQRVSQITLNVHVVHYQPSFVVAGRAISDDEAVNGRWVRLEPEVSMQFDILT
jgi:hypothetical protein